MLPIEGIQILPEDYLLPWSMNLFIPTHNSLRMYGYTTMLSYILRTGNVFLYLPDKALQTEASS